LTDGISMTSQGEDLFLRGEGSLNARNCDEFRKQVYSLVQGGVKKVHLDLAKCSYMDSTFLGLLVGVHKKLRQFGGVGLTVYTPSASAQEHLHSMGIDRIITISGVTFPFPEIMETCTSRPTENPQDILTAHQHLMDLSAENRKRFAILAQVLDKEIQKKII